MAEGAIVIPSGRRHYPAGMFERRLLIVTGKGGVGRSALTAALALRAANEGKQVLAIASGDDVGLATHLGVDRLSYHAEEIRPGLHAMVIERPAALNEYLRVQIGVPKIAQLGPLAGAFDALASTAPGIREVITIGKVLYEARSGGWDLVVVDGPPTGQIASHLRAPATVSKLVGTGRVKEQTGWMIELLLDPASTGLIIVTLPEELPVSETTQALEEITSENLCAIAGLVTNRTLDPLGVTPTKVEALPDGPAKDAARLHSAVYEEQQHWLRQLPKSLHIPYLFGLLTPAEVAARMADLWSCP